jgi:hypothetical protein
MADKILTTFQGQAWDMIALNEYGSEYAMSHLLAANPQARGVLLFSGEKKLALPALPDDEAQVVQESLPPWKRNLEAKS